MNNAGSWGGEENKLALSRPNHYKKKKHSTDLVGLYL